MNYERPSVKYDVFDSFYRSLTLFGLGGGVDPPVPASLQIARFLAPFALGFAAFQGFIHLFRDQLQVASIRFRVHRHVVVAGLGSQGSKLVRSFYDEGLPVVAIELDATNAAIATCRALGVPVLVGDAREPLVLRRARISHARQLIVTCG